MLTIRRQSLTFHSVNPSKMSDFPTINLSCIESVQSAPAAVANSSLVTGSSDDNQPNSQSNLDSLREFLKRRGFSAIPTRSGGISINNNDISDENVPDPDMSFDDMNIYLSLGELGPPNLSDDTAREKEEVLDVARDVQSDDVEIGIEEVTVEEAHNDVSVVESDGSGGEEGKYLSIMRIMVIMITLSYLFIGDYCIVNYHRDNNNNNNNNDTSHIALLSSYFTNVDNYEGIEETP